MDLFEDIRKILDCDYISDIKNDVCRKKVLRIAMKMNLEDYPLSQVSDFANYLENENKSFNTVDEARAYFVKLQNSYR